MGYFEGTPLGMWATAIGLSLAGLLWLLAQATAGSISDPVEAYHSGGFGKE